MTVVIYSIQVGRPRTFAAENSNAKSWQSAILKSEVQGAIGVRKTNLEGDQQADLIHHGGPEKAVLAYSRHHYDLWQQEFPEKCFEGGAFGENLTIEGLRETDVCVGDIYKAGSCLLQISQHFATTSAVLEAVTQMEPSQACRPCPKNGKNGLVFACSGGRFSRSRQFSPIGGSPLSGNHRRLGARRHACQTARDSG